MSTIHLTTFIKAPQERVFDLSRSISIYKQVFDHQQQSISTGAASNLLELGETITVQVKHLGKIRMVLLKLTDFEKPNSFIIEQTTGALLYFKHEHYFKPADNGCILIDMINYQPPKDFIGKLILRFYLKKYLHHIIQLRNEYITTYAETNKWEALLT
jgi:ligand-binding SRPBCC domain-containing protein